MDGWIKLHRKISNNGLWTCEPFTRGQAWVDLLLLASHKGNYFYVRGIKINLKRGQLAWSENKLSDRWKWSRSKLRKFLKELEKEQQIEQQKNNVIQVITIINYNEYQLKEQQIKQQKDRRKTAERPQKDTYKNVKKDNNEKNVKENIIYPWMENEFLQIWEFWKKYKREQFNFSYKEIGEQGALSKLYELSGGKLENAMMIVKQSIQNGWKGFFELKNEPNKIIDNMKKHEENLEYFKNMKYEK